MQSFQTPFRTSFLVYAPLTIHSQDIKSWELFKKWVRA